MRTRAFRSWTGVSWGSGPLAPRRHLSSISSNIRFDSRDDPADGKLTLPKRPGVHSATQGDRAAGRLHCPARTIEALVAHCFPAVRADQGPTGDHCGAMGAPFKVSLLNMSLIKDSLCFVRLGLGIIHLPRIRVIGLWKVGR